MKAILIIFRKRKQLCSYLDAIATLILPRGERNIVLAPRRLGALLKDQAQILASRQLDNFYNTNHI